jgi:hypothetical protein
MDHLPLDASSAIMLTTGRWRLARPAISAVRLSPGPGVLPGRPTGAQLADAFGAETTVCPARAKGLPVGR